jgi:hypothetical protein
MRRSTLAVLPILLLASGCGSQQTAFDQKRWLTADLLKREREEMLTSLLKQHPIIGRSKRQVVTLLGEPSDTAKWGNSISYVLGPSGGFGIDNAWLILELDNNQRVVSYRKAED